MPAITTVTQGMYWMLQLAADSSGSPGTFTTIGAGTSDAITETFETSRTVNKQAGIAGSSVISGNTWSASFEGDYIPGGAGQLVVKAAIAAQKGANPTAYWVRFTQLDDLSDSGDAVVDAPYFQGQAWITSRGLTAGTTENIKLSLQFEGQGALTEGVVV